jgi:signal transduction histidine kinase
VRALGFEPSVVFDGPVDVAVPEHVAEHLLAMLREAVSNVARHSGASAATIDIRVNGQLTVSVTDDGRGGVTGATATGHGLRNMAQRAQSLGGTFTIGPAASGRGTTATWSVPL